MADITIKWVEPAVEIEVDMSRLTWRDLVEFQRVRDSVLDDEQRVELVTKLVSRITGQDAWELPAQVVAQIANEALTRTSLGGTAKN